MDIEKLRFKVGNGLKNTICDYGYCCEYKNSFYYCDRYVFDHDYENKFDLNYRSIHFKNYRSFYMPLVIIIPKTRRTFTSLSKHNKIDEELRVYLGNMFMGVSELYKHINFMFTLVKSKRSLYKDKELSAFDETVMLWVRRALKPNTTFSYT